MITLSTLQAYLSAPESLSPSINQSVNGQAHYLLKLLTTLPSQTQARQAEHLEKVLTILRGTNIDEQQRLKLTAAVIAASDQLIATLRQYYIYETGALSDAQLAYVAQTKSLYYLTIMVYDTVIRHKTARLKSQRKPSKNKGWQRYFKTDKPASMTLAVAIYQTLLMYQKLLGEDAICYQATSLYLWSKINQLYHLAYQYHLADTDLRATGIIVTHAANTIHQLYCQICLHSLLNMCAMRRPHILLAQRLLPDWAKHLVATIEPKTETRVFVDLQGNHPPTYLTANSDINPYDDCCHCLFIDLVPMVEYFESRIKALCNEDSEGVECYLLNKVSMTIAYRYLQRPFTQAAKTQAKRAATLVTGFNNIHYRVGCSPSFASLIATEQLPEEQRPRYDTVSQKQASIDVVISEAVDGHGDNSVFRTLQLPETSDRGLAVKKGVLQTIASCAEGVVGDTGVLNKEPRRNEKVNAVVVDNDGATTAPPPLYMMSLFLVCRSDPITPTDWTLGVVRWLNLDTKRPMIEWQVLGHKLVACGVRLEGRKTRGRHFVPAFIVGKSEQLQTTGTLIVPTSYFQTDDRVIMRVNTKQTPLRLGHRLFVTDEFSQYEVVRL